MDESTYDKRLRPRYGAGHVDVGISIHVSSVSAISEVSMIIISFCINQKNKLRSIWILLLIFICARHGTIQD